MEWRRKLLLQAAKNVDFREKVKEFFFRDILFAFNAFFFTYDVRKRPLHQQPFCTYDYQDETILELVRSINEGEDALIEKSRDMGASWIVILVFVWFWLNPAGGADFLCGSRIKDYVDGKGDMRTLFEKVRYALYKLPIWLRPKGFRRAIHDNFARLQNPETGASITGESNNPNFSTGGRYAGVLFDEFAKWELSDESAWTAAGDATPCRIPISTPFGAGGQYYNLVSGEKIKRTTLHWTLHPEKSVGLYCEYPPPNASSRDMEGWEPEVKFRSPWYDGEEERRSPLEMAQEVDIDYLGAGNPVFDGKAGIALKYYRALKIEPIGYYDFLTDGRVERPRDTENYLILYEEPNKDTTYAICSDVAEGKIEGDWSVIKVLNRETKGVAATVHTHVDENQLADYIAVVAKLFSDEESHEYPWVGIEAGLGPGLATFDKCLDIGVPNLFMMPKYEIAKNTVTYRKGWITSKTSKKVLIAGIKDYLANKEGFIDPRCVGELGTFVRSSTNSAEAKSGCHDDEVITFGICLQVDEIAPYTPKKTEVERPFKERVFREEGFEKLDAPRTLQEQCLAQAIVKQSDVTRTKAVDFEDAIDFMYEYE